MRPGTWTSLPNRARPVTLSAPSWRIGRVPTTEYAIAVDVDSLSVDIWRTHEERLRAGGEARFGLYARRVPRPAPLPAWAAGPGRQRPIGLCLGSRVVAHAFTNT